MLANVQQQTIAPLIKAVISPGTQVYTDEYDIYARLSQWGYEHRTVCHSAGEYARDEDGDGFHEVHVNTIEGFHYCALGSVPTGVSLKRSCRCIWASSSSFTTPASAARDCSSPCSASCWRSCLESIKSLHCFAGVHILRSMEKSLSTHHPIKPLGYHGRHRFDYLTVAQTGIIARQ